MFSRIILIICSLLTFSAASAFAHPHVFVDCSTQIVFDPQGLSGVRTTWYFDEMTSAQYLMDLDLNNDGKLTSQEWELQREDISGFLGEQSFFLHVMVNGQKTPVQQVKNFTARFKDGFLEYSLFAPLSVPYANGNTNVQVAVYDPSFYSDFYTPIDGVILEGAKPSVTLDVDDAPELAFYSGQVVPIAARLTF